MINNSQKKWNSKNRDKLRGYQRAWELKNPEHYLWCSARARARKYGLPFSIEIKDIVIPSVCPVLGLPLVFHTERSPNRMARPNAPSVDRIIPAAGYVPGNVRVISWRANDIKGNATFEELEAVVFELRRLRDK
jgi:hypothetical protein